QKPFKPLRIRQESRAPPLGHNRFRRTSQIQIDLFITILTKLLRRADKVLRPVRQNLRNRIHSPVVPGKAILLFSCTEMPHLVRADKRDKVSVKSSKTLVHRIPVNPAGDPLQGSQIQSHKFLSCPFHFLPLSPYSARNGRKICLPLPKPYAYLIIKGRVCQV